MATGKVMITGGAGYFGGLLREHLIGRGIRCLALDRLPAEQLPNSPAVQVDLRDRKGLEAVFAEHGPFGTVFHLAAELAHAMRSPESLWESNVQGTAHLAQVSLEHGVSKLVFASSNCLWGKPFPHPVREDEPPCPAGIYGRSKWEAEKILRDYPGLNATLIRCPTIISSGRLGLLSILFDFIREGRRVYTVGRGENRYQFVYGPDLAEAFWLASQEQRPAIYNVGSDRVESLRQNYQSLIDQVGSGSRIVALPKRPVLFLMRLAHRLGISPLGPYHYRMISESFCFDTARIKKSLDWRPTRTNGDMLVEAYEAYLRTLANPTESALSDHRRPAAMGVIRLLKWIS